EADELGRTVRALAADGRAVVFISHKLREVLAVADRVAVLRRGKLVQVTARAETSAGQLAEAVMGKPLAAAGSEVAELGLPEGSLPGTSVPLDPARGPPRHHPDQRAPPGAEPDHPDSITPRGSDTLLEARELT